MVDYLTPVALWVSRSVRRFSFLGLLLSVVCFSISLSPSLLPRPLLLQGLLSGLCLVLGYGLGVLLQGVWRYLQLPELSAPIRLWSQSVACILALILFSLSIWHFEYWHNDVRSLMNRPEADDLSIVVMIVIALLLALLLSAIAAGLKRLLIVTSRQLKIFLPPRIAKILGVLLIGFMVFSLSNNYIARQIVQYFDAVYSLADANTDTGIEPPHRSKATGHSDSLIRWHDLGRQGQNFIAAGPSQREISDVVGQTAKQPLRVYVGLRSADTPEQRAQLALTELIRVGGFARSKLIIATPTGTGWLDESAVDSVEYLHQGDTAIVAMQYSYLPSWLTLLVDPTASRQSAAALYGAVHSYWAKLPSNQRPDLYLFGLSLGALAAETSVNLTTIVKDPIQGAVLAGAPFLSTISSRLIKRRNSDSPQWLPVIQDGSMVRFTAQDNQLNNNPNWQWGPMRFVYIQYASDPMVFFSFDLLRTEPDWLKASRGPDLSRSLRWYPGITFLQVLFDLPMADRVPRGHAHHYSASSYLDAWIEVTEPKLLLEPTERKIREFFAQR